MADAQRRLRRLKSNRKLKNMDPEYGSGFSICRAHWPSLLLLALLIESL